VKRFAVALAAVVLGAGAAACAQDGADEPVPGTLAAYLEVDPEECGLDDGPERADLDPARQARTTAAQVHALLPVVEDLRELDHEGPVPTSFIAPDELQRRFEEEVLEEYPAGEAETDRRALELLGAIPQGYPLRRRITEMAAGFVAGYYDPDDEDIVIVREPGGRLDDTELQTLGHELVHALAYAAFEPEEGDASDGWGDTYAAVSSLVEGDAVAAELRLLRGLLGERMQEEIVREGPIGYWYPAPDLPSYLAYAWSFPYREGIGFVCTLYAEGGWDAVDAAYRRLPTSSAEILFPQRYLDGWKPIRPRAPRGPGPGWTKATKSSGVFGAADLVALFRAPAGDLGAELDNAVGRAAAWSGGRADVWTRGKRSALGLTLVDGSRERGLCSSMAAWYEAAFPGAVRRGGDEVTGFSQSGRYAVIRCSGPNVFVALSDDREAAETFAAGAAFD
jgi:hypothetical protein